MARKSILQFDGFEELLEEIKAADGDTERVIKAAAESGAQAYKQALNAECRASGVPSDVIQEIEKTVTAGKDYASARVGWKMGGYNPENPSAGYKAVFLNYGTPRRTTKTGANRGKVTKKGFIANAKRKARSKIKKAQKEALENILSRLKK